MKKLLSYILIISLLFACVPKQQRGVRRATPDTAVASTTVATSEVNCCEALANCSNELIKRPAASNVSADGLFHMFGWYNNLSPMTQVELAAAITSIILGGLTFAGTTIKK
jgi:ABC-type multidrug transport system permease subunit